MISSNLDNDFTELSVGETVSWLAGPQGITFQMDDGGGFLLMRFDRPTMYEQEAIGKPCEFRLVMIGSVIFLLFKPAGMPWNDMPYTVHLSPGWTEMRELKDKERYLSVIVLCGTDGHIYRLRTATFSPRFSREFRKMAMKQMEMPFDYTQYMNEINSIQARYSSDELANLASIYCKNGECNNMNITVFG